MTEPFADVAPSAMIMVIIQGKTSDVDLESSFMPTMSLTFGPQRTATGHMSSAYLLSVELDFGAVGSSHADLLEDQEGIRQGLWGKLAAGLAQLHHLQQLRLLFPSLILLKRFAEKSHGELVKSLSEAKIKYHYKIEVGEYVRERRVDVAAVLKERCVYR